MYRLFLTLLTMQMLVGTCVEAPAATPFWQKLVPRKQVQVEADGNFVLTKAHGPWLVMAASFSGPEGELQANELVAELRREYNMKAFYYGMTFEKEDSNPGRGIDDYGSRIRRRYNRGSSIREHAVLVGEFPSLGDHDAQELLDQIKHLQPGTLDAKNGETTAQNLASVRQQFKDYLRKKTDKVIEKGPMGHAFLTRNPLLPKEYFVPQGVDEDIAQWNEKLEYSLMSCPEKYSVRVATFRGRSSLKATDQELQDKRTRKAKDDDPLVIAAENAHLLTVALREKGWEAYEFHDRHESYVAVGSFQNAQEQENGRIVLNDRDAQIIINTFGASSPNNIFNRPAPQDLSLEAAKKQQFKSMFNGQQMGQVSEGFHPKRFVGMPFDIYPEPVRVPRRSISSAYARQ